MKKLIFKFFLISLFTCLSFFSIDRVYAAVHNFSAMSGGYTRKTETGGTYTSPSYSMYQVDYAGSTVFTGDYNPFYFGGTFTLEPIELNFYAPNFNACGGDDITIAGHIYGIENNTSANGYGSIGSFQMTASTVYNGRNNMSCVISKASNNVFSFNCSGKGGSGLDMHFKFFNYSWPRNSQAYYFGIYRDISYSCEMNSSAIINNNNENTQSIINSQNSNTQSIINSQKEQMEQSKKQHEEIMNDDTTESSNAAESFFSGFTTDTHGLTSIITAPLELIGNIACSTCSPLPLQVPFVEDKTINLPCMKSIYSQHFGSLLTVYQTATFGLVAYWVCVRIFALVKDFKNPDHDEIEVMDL